MPCLALLELSLDFRIELRVAWLFKGARFYKQVSLCFKVRIVSLVLVVSTGIWIRIRITVLINRYVYRCGVTLNITVDWRTDFAHSGKLEFLRLCLLCSGNLCFGKHIVYKSSFMIDTDFRTGILIKYWYLPHIWLIEDAWTERSESLYCP